MALLDGALGIARSRKLLPVTAPALDMGAFGGRFVTDALLNLLLLFFLGMWGSSLSLIGVLFSNEC